MNFHKQKLWLHRATMKRCESMLQAKGFSTLYLEYDSEPGSLLRQLTEVTKKLKASPRTLIVADPMNVPCKFLVNPSFINAT